MGHRLSKIVTKTGDNGTTGLGNGQRVDKDSHRIQTIGDLDELNSLIGVLLSQNPPDSVLSDFNRIQHRLFDIGGELSMPGRETTGNDCSQELETLIEKYNDKLPPLKEFILPGGSPAAAYCHLSRTVCRRVERNLVSLNKTEPISAHILKYINRLSDFLFIMARVINKQHGIRDIYWQSERIKST